MRGAVWVAVVTLLAAPAAAYTSAPIVNGVDTVEYPAVGALLSPGDPNRAALVCSGTLIGCHTFLTAAHCVAEDLDPSSYVVYLQHAGFVGVSAIARHPAYDFPVADVAVLTLSATVTGIRPVPIDTTGDRAPDAAGTIVGFGRTGGTNLDYGLKRRGRVGLAPCAGDVSDTTSVCWHFTSPIGSPGDDSNTCNGDSGGPLLVDDGAGDVVAGVTSGGSSATCLATDDSYDARVATYATYIQAVGAGDTGARACSSLAQVGEPDATVAAFAGLLDSTRPTATHAFTVPRGAEVLRVTMNAVDDGSDFDLYVRAGSAPTLAAYDCAARGIGQFGACEFPNPPPGIWYMMLDRYVGGGGYQVTATAFASRCADAGSDGAPCDDGNACTTGERCADGVCAAGDAVACDDGIPCTLDACIPTTGCAHAAEHAVCGPCAACDAAAGCVSGPRPDCLPTTATAASVLRIRDAAAAGGDVLAWKWTKGAATSADDLGFPAAKTTYRLCLYDESGATPGLALRADVPAAGVCDGGPCWQDTGGTLRYRNPARAPNGISKLVVKAGGAGRAKATLKGRGALLPRLPGLPLALPVRVQLHADDAACLEAVFGSGGVVRNDRAGFVGRGD